MTQKTLEEIAEEFARLRYINECVNPTGNMISKSIACRVGFMAGAEWQRNHVWRRNTEMPSDEVNKDGIGKPCMVKEGSRVFLCHACRTTIGKYYFTDHLHTWHPVENVDCWAYLDDLMPTSFDEILEENKDVLQRLKKGEVK